MTSPDGLQKALACVRAALDKKAFDPVILDVAEFTTIASHIVLLSGRSDRQVQAIAQAIEEQLRNDGCRPLATEGAQRGHWILVDCSDVIVHVFYEPVRAFYDLERLWHHAPRVPLPAPLAQQASL